MEFIARLEEALQHAEGQRIESDAIVAESFANCVADNELQKLCPPARLSDARNKLLQTKSFDNLVQSYDLPPLIAGDVLQLALFDAVLLVDDCSSMNEGTKWSDVKCIVEQIVDMVSQCNSSGLRVEFVHRNARALGVTSSEDLQLLFDGMHPQGCTPFIQPLAAKVLDPFYACCRRRRSSVSGGAHALEASRVPDVQAEASPSHRSAPNTAAAAVHALPAAAAQTETSCISGSSSSSGSSFMQQLQEKRRSRDLQLDMGPGFASLLTASLTAAAAAPSAAREQSGAGSSSAGSSPLARAADCSPADVVKPIVVYVITDRPPTAQRSQQLFAKVDAVLRSFGLPRCSVNIGIVDVCAGAEPQHSSTLDPSHPLNPFTGSRMSYIGDYEAEAAALGASAPALTPDMYIVKLLLGPIDPRYASEAADEATLVAADSHATPQGGTVPSSLSHLQQSDDDQTPDPDDQATASRGGSVSAPVRCRRAAAPRSDSRSVVDMVSKMCAQPPKPKLSRRNTGQGWSAMKIVQVLDDMVHFAM